MARRKGRKASQITELDRALLALLPEHKRHPAERALEHERSDTARNRRRWDATLKLREAEERLQNLSELPRPKTIDEAQAWRALLHEAQAARDSLREHLLDLSKSKRRRATAQRRPQQPASARASTHPPARPEPMQAQQERRLLEILSRAGFDPSALPPYAPGKVSPAKQAAKREALKIPGITREIFEKAWKRLSKSGLIAYS